MKDEGADAGQLFPFHHSSFIIPPSGSPVQGTVLTAGSLQAPSPAALTARARSQMRWPLVKLFTSARVLLEELLSTQLVGVGGSMLACSS